MGLFSKLFDKKECSVCGGEIGLFGNRKLEDGNLCKECAAKLSPFFSDRKNSTVEEIKAQLEYRENNKQTVADFNPTKTIDCNNMVLYFDEDKALWLAAGSSDWRGSNPDVLTYAQMIGCELDIEENRTELMQKDKDGNEVSYRPPRYDLSYDFDLTLRVNSPWFSTIEFRMNDHDEVKIRNGSDYRRLQAKVEEIKEVFSQAREKERTAAAAAAAPKVAKVCPACGASTVPDANGCCEYCGSALND